MKGSRFSFVGHPISQWILLQVCYSTCIMFSEIIQAYHVQFCANIGNNIGPGCRLPYHGYTFLKFARRHIAKRTKLGKVAISINRPVRRLLKKWGQM